jgi:hypothetical protein
MRDKLSVLYYPDFWVEYNTLIKCILLFDEIHFMDRPSFMFNGRYGMVGCASPLRQYEQSFRDEGVPLYVHEAPGGPVYGDLLGAVEADLADATFMTQFQEGLRSSQLFRRLHIQPGDYGQGRTHDTIFQMMSAVDLLNSRSPLEVFNDANVPHMETTTTEGCLKTLASEAAFCSTKMNYALRAGSENGFVPLADASPYAKLLSAKYNRAIGSPSYGERQIHSTDLSMAIFDELLPAQLLGKLKIGDAIKYRKESVSARDAFLEHLTVLHAKFGEVPPNSDYPTAINKIITTEILPAARAFRSKLDTICEKLFGNILEATVISAGSAIAWAGSQTTVQVLGDITWQKLLSLAVMGAAYVGSKAIGSYAEARAVSRESALSYLLDLEQ